MIRGEPLLPVLPRNPHARTGGKERSEPEDGVKRGGVSASEAVMEIPPLPGTAEGGFFVGREGGWMGE